MVLSPQMAAAIETLRHHGTRLPDDLAERRRALDDQMRGPCADGVDEEPHPLGRRMAVEFRPGHDTGRVGLYLHGGAYQLGSIDAYRSFVSRLSLALDTTMYLLDYRLAPEHPFPAAIDDALEAYDALLAEGHDPTRVVIIGDSAGGGLTVATLLAIDHERLPQPGAAVSLSGWLDLTNSSPSYERCAASDPFVTRDDSHRAARAYLGGADPSDRRASPVFARRRSLSRLAPLLLQASADEVLCDDSSTMAERITDAGGIAEVQLYEGLTHVWHVMPDSIPEVAQATGAIRAFVDRYLPLAT